MKGASASATYEPLIAENIPEQLIERPQWVNWRIETRGDLSTKVPYVAGTATRASHSDLMTWRSFPECFSAYRKAEPLKYDGIGFVFCSGDPYVGIDLDGCRNPKTGEIEAWAQEIIDLFAGRGYVEASPSGTGVHIIVQGKVDAPVKTERVEVYEQRRFFTITGGAL